MAIVALLDPLAPMPLQVSWATWFAGARQLALTIVLPESGTSRSKEVLQKQVESLIEREQDFVLDSGEELGEEGGPLRCRVRFADVEAEGDVIETISAAIPELLLVLLQKVDASDVRASRIGREILPRVSCSVAVVDLGDQRWPLEHLMVAASRGSHPRAALQLSRDLAVQIGGRITGVYVEPDIGTDAQSVGRHVLGKVLKSALPEAAIEISKSVVVAENVQQGLRKACEVIEPDAVVMGMPRPGLLGPRFFGLTPARLCKHADAPVVILREALPLGNRLRRSMEDVLQRVVPQVARETRVELAARVQSSSAWNFDFVALISLSAVIAALGLLQNSAAVIIGAMLIAPLMTPILGIGLALAQGNAVLARLAFRAIAYGVGTAFALAALVGVIDGCTHESLATEEMLARGWPGVSDLVVAFVSGLAAAYAHSRPGLIAALPGVAIAAALVPPIATSGLAFAAGDLRLAYGSFLLFFANMVAIVLAASLSLWAVGVRRQIGNGWLRRIGNAFVVLALALAVHLSQRTRLGQVVISSQVHSSITASLPKEWMLLSVAGVRREEGLVVTIKVGGARRPEARLATQLGGLVTELLQEPVHLRLEYAWQSVALPGSK
jgi:uncharacterized hydrophobic protein (TIGR00271 family)